MIRPRTSADLEACGRLVSAVLAVDGYPAYGSGDLGGFVADSGALGAWVAEDGADMVGHVALDPRGSEEVMALAARHTGLARQRLCAVSRLFVSPDLRRRGLGRLLLDTATGGALNRGLRPILEVVARSAAVAFYRASGWTLAGDVTVPLPDGTTIDELVFVAGSPGEGAVVTPRRG